MKKYQRSDIVGVERENERDETYHFKTNPQIDGERTRFNHHFISPNGSYTAFINRRLKELAPKRKVKDDAVLMASFFIGASPAFFTDKSRDDIDTFFFECTDFFAERYGRENIISAVVHMDETTPHLHLNLMPILEGRPCAKKLFERKALVALQTDLYREVGRHWGLERGQEGSQAQHLDTVEFKLKKMQEAAVTAQRQANAANEQWSKRKRRNGYRITNDGEKGENGSGRRYFRSRHAVAGKNAAPFAAGVPCIGRGPQRLRRMEKDTKRLKRQIGRAHV